MLLKSLSIYALASIINSAIPFLLLPILTSYLTTEEYGILTIIQIFIVFTIPFISINIYSTLQIEYTNLDKDDFAIWVSSVLVIPLFTIVGVLIVFISFASVVANIANTSLFLILIVPIIAFMQVIPQTILALYQISERPIDYAKYQILLSIVNITLTIGFVVVLKMSLDGRVIAIFMSYALFTALGIYLLVKMKLIVFKIEKKYIYEALKLGTPLIIHVVSGVLFMMSDRLFISYYIGNDEAGIYAVGAQVAMIALVIQQSFNQAWVPYLFKNLKSNCYENKVKIVNISYYAFAFFITLPFIVDMLSYPVFSYFIDKNFLHGRHYVFWVALGFGLLGMYKVVTNYIFYEKKTYYLSMLTFISLIINIFLNYILLHKYGTIGVAYATTITIGIFFVVTFFIANKVHSMPWLYFIKRKN